MRQVWHLGVESFVERLIASAALDQYAQREVGMLHLYAGRRLPDPVLVDHEVLGMKIGNEPAAGVEDGQRHGDRPGRPSECDLRRPQWSGGTLEQRRPSLGRDRDLTDGRENGCEEGAD